MIMCSCATTPARPPQATSLDHGLLIARVFSRGALIRYFVSAADAGTLEALDASGAPMPGLKAVSGLAAGGCIVFFDLPKPQISAAVHDNMIRDAELLHEPFRIRGELFMVLY